MSMCRYRLDVRILIVNQSRVPAFASSPPMGSSPFQSTDIVCHETARARVTQPRRSLLTPRPGARRLRDDEDIAHRLHATRVAPRCREQALASLPAPSTAHCPRPIPIRPRGLQLLAVRGSPKGERQARQEKCPARTPRSVTRTRAHRRHPMRGGSLHIGALCHSSSRLKP